MRCPIAGSLSGAYPKLKKYKAQLLSVSISDSESDENPLHYPITHLFLLIHMCLMENLKMLCIIP